jgi:hypothetical protein
VLGFHPTMSHTFLWCQIMVSSLFHHSKKGHSSVPQIPMHKEGHSIMCDGILLKALGRIDLQHTHTHTYTHTNTHTHTHTHTNTHTHTQRKCLIIEVAISNTHRFTHPLFCFLLHCRGQWLSPQYYCCQVHLHFLTPMFSNSLSNSKWKANIISIMCF